MCSSPPAWLTLRRRRDRSAPSSHSRPSLQSSKQGNRYQLQDWFTSEAKKGYLKITGTAHSAQPDGAIRVFGVESESNFCCGSGSFFRRSRESEQKQTKKVRFRSIEKENFLLKKKKKYKKMCFYHGTGTYLFLHLLSCCISKNKEESEYEKFKRVRPTNWGRIYTQNVLSLTFLASASSKMMSISAPPPKLSPKKLWK